MRAIRMALLLTLMVGLPAAAEAATKTCYERGPASLVARNVGCGTAERVYQASLRKAAETERATTRFRYRGVRWSCRAKNTSVYTWRCTASKRRLVRYRWSGGE